MALGGEQTADGCGGKRQKRVKLYREGKRVKRKKNRVGKGEQTVDG